MRLCSYVVVHDHGFAPNPFHGYCTLAACTPNHQGLRLAAGDWLLGNSTAATGNRLIYAMRVSEVMDFDRYFRDPRFTAKKARRDGWQNRCGDNIYHRDETGRWRQALAFFHTEVGRLEKDTVHPRVFISDFFFYFGGQAPAVPAELGSLLQTRQGCRCNHDPATVAAFVEWLTSTCSPGLHGLPRDNPGARTGHTDCSCSLAVPGPGLTGAPDDRLPGMRGRPGLRRTNGLRTGPAPLAPASLGRPHPFRERREGP